MNRKNVETAIKIMQRSRNKVSMLEWQSTSDSGSIVFNEQEFHQCGNTACFAGHIAISPEFHADGGDVTPPGAPFFKSVHGEYAISAWLERGLELAESLVYGDCDQRLLSPDTFSCFYNKRWGDVTSEDVIAKLQLILDGQLT